MPCGRSRALAISLGREVQQVTQDDHGALFRRQPRERGERLVGRAAGGAGREVRGELRRAGLRELAPQLV